MKWATMAAFVFLFGMGPASPALADDDRYRDYRGYDGYRDRPYNKNRHYRHHEYRGKGYTYQGHWRSWDEWDRYSRNHPDVRRHGRYYHEGSHLMFRSCPPGSGTCLFFSIGR